MIVAAPKFRPGMSREQRKEHRDAMQELASTGGRPAQPLTWWQKRIETERDWWAMLRRNRKGWDEIVLHRALSIVAAMIWIGYTSPRGFLFAHLLGTCSRATLQVRVRACRDCPSRRHKQGLKDVATSHCWGQPGGRTCCPTGRYWPFSRLGWMLRLVNRGCPLERFKAAPALFTFAALIGVIIAIVGLLIGSPVALLGLALVALAAAVGRSELI